MKLIVYKFIHFNSWKKYRIGCDARIIAIRIDMLLLFSVKIMQEVVELDRSVIIINSLIDEFHCGIPPSPLLFFLHSIRSG